MSVDCRVDIILGFRVPYDKLFTEKKNIYYLCNHNFDRSQFKFCPECGKSSVARYSITAIPIIDTISFDDLGDYGGRIKDSELSLVQIQSNGDLRKTEKDYYIGKKCFAFDPMFPDAEISESDLTTPESIIQQIENTKLNIPYDPATFKLYCLYSAW